MYTLIHGVTNPKIGITAEVLRVSDTQYEVTLTCDDTGYTLPAPAVFMREEYAILHAEILTKSFS